MTELRSDHGAPRAFRPVTVDADGRIILESGEQLIIAGLEPEGIRQWANDKTIIYVNQIVAETRGEFLAKLDALCEDDEGNFVVGAGPRFRG